jgi:predicted O-linked N-acetylglucosamine transferase (SPINDLY family)
MLAGHSALSTTQRYIEGAEEARRRVVEMVESPMKDQDNFQTLNTDDYNDQQIKMHQSAAVFYQHGKRAEAKKLFRDCIMHYPDDLYAMQMIAVIAREQKEYLESEKFFVNAIALKPDFTSLRLNYGILLKEVGRFDEAIFQFMNAVSLAPSNYKAIYNLGLVLNKLPQADDALIYFQNAVFLNPFFYDAYFQIGVILHERTRYDEAISYFNRVIRIKPDFAIAYYAIGVSLCELNCLVEALIHYDRASFLDPNNFQAVNNRGNVLSKLKRYQEALSCYNRGIEITRNHGQIFLNQGIMLHELKNFKKALESYEWAVSLMPHSANAYNACGNLMIDLKLYDEAFKSFEKAIICGVDNFGIQSNFLLMLTYLETTTASYRTEKAREFGHNVSRGVMNKFSSWKTCKTEQQLRIGFVSGDFNAHPVGYFLENVLSKLDRKKIEAIAYSNNLAEDETTKKIKSNFSTYNSIAELTNYEAAASIHADGVQILVDLSGHTALNRLPMFAFKPAPIQMSWLGYWSTTGMKEIDYILGDPYVTPPVEEDHFTERVKRLPETYFCFTPPAHMSEIKNLPALENDFITFGCFNSFSKVTKKVMTLWAKILHEIPKSRLFLKARQLGDPQLVNETKEFFYTLGIPTDRLLFEGSTNRVDYFSSYNKVDIALDPFPYPGGTTSVEGLWMGVPVITKKGNCFIAHNGETIAHNSGQADWIAQDDDEYIAKAVRFSTDLQALARLRSGLRAQVLASPLFDAKRFARNFEKAMFEIWEEHKKENPSD